MSACFSRMTKYSQHSIYPCSQAKGDEPLRLSLRDVANLPGYGIGDSGGGTDSAGSRCKRPASPAKSSVGSSTGFQSPGRAPVWALWSPEKSVPPQIPQRAGGGIGGLGAGSSGLTGRSFSFTAGDGRHGGGLAEALASPTLMPRAAPVTSGAARSPERHAPSSNHGADLSIRIPRSSP